MRTRAQRKASSRANALRKGEENAKKRGEALTLKKPAQREAEPVRDGLLWLIRKGKLNPTRRLAAALYRSAYREPQEGAMRSCLNDNGASSTVTGPPGVNERRADAIRRLHAIRKEALAAQEQLIFVMDGVVGGGLTLREMTGGDERAAGKLEAILMVALDLVAAWDRDRDTKAA